METDLAKARGPAPRLRAARLAAGVHGLQHEVGALWAWLRERELWLVLVIGLALWALAYQVPYTFHLDFGGDQRTRQRNLDEPFINFPTGWNEKPEPQSDDWADASNPPYRWAFAHATLDFPGAGGGPWRVSMLIAGQPIQQPTLSTWSDGTLTTTVPIAPRPRLYQHLFQAHNGDLRLAFDTPPYRSATDPRALGFVGYSATIQSVGGLRLPALRYLGFFALITACCYGIARRLAIGRRLACTCTLVLGLVVALLLAFWRMPLTLVAPAVAVVVAACYPLALVLVRLPLGDSSKAIVGHESVQRYAVALVLLALVVRLAGLLHPTIIFSDIGINTRELIGVVSGNLYQQERLPGELGGGWAPYPPAQYIVLAPLALFVDPSSEQPLRAQVGTVLKIGNALLDSMVVGMIWYALWRRGYGQRAALFGAALYLLPPPAFKAFGVGEFANIAGQALAMPLLVALPLFGARLREPKVFWPLGALLLLALLGHSGVTLSVLLLLGCLGLIWLIDQQTRRAAVWLLALGGLAALLVGLFYYSAYLHLFSDADATVVPRASVGFLTRLGYERNRALGEFLRPLSPLLIALGALGVFTLMRRPRRLLPGPALGPLLLAWWGSVALSLGLLLLRAQTVRWDLFLYPALCLAAGPLLVALWRHGRAGKATVTLLLAFLLVRGLFYWIWLVSDQYH